MLSDDSLILNPFVTRESHLLLDISLRDVLLDQNMKILVRIINYVNQSQTRVIPVQGEYSRSTILYPFIRNSQLPKVEEGFQKFRIQVALIINGKTGPYSPRAADLQEQVPVGECSISSCVSHLLLNNQYEHPLHSILEVSNVYNYSYIPGY